MPARVLEHALLTGSPNRARRHPVAHGKVFATIAGTARACPTWPSALLTKQSMQYLVDDLERLGYAERSERPPGGAGRPTP